MTLGATDEAASTESVGRGMRHLGRLIDGDTERWALVRTTLGQLQARLDRDTEEFLGETASRREREPVEFRRLAGLFMQHAVECFEGVAEGLGESLSRAASLTLHNAEG